MSKPKTSTDRPLFSLILYENFLNWWESSVNSHRLTLVSRVPCKGINLPDECTSTSGFNVFCTCSPFVCDTGSYIQGLRADILAAELCSPLVFFFMRASRVLMKNEYAHIDYISCFESLDVETSGSSWRLSRPWLSRKTLLFCVWSMLTESDLVPY